MVCVVHVRIEEDDYSPDGRHGFLGLRWSRAVPWHGPPVASDWKGFVLAGLMAAILFSLVIAPWRKDGVSGC